MHISKDRILKYSFEPLAFLKWLLFACVIGVVVGLVSISFYYAFDFVTDLRLAHPWLLFLLPLGGVAIILVYRISGMENDRGTNFVLLAVRENTALPLRTAPLVYISTLITHLLGGSSGREGAILQIGGSISASIGRAMHLDDKDSRIITMCGMSAAFAALFGTPIAAAVFAMEIVSVGVMYYAAIVPCVLSAIIGVGLAETLSVAPTAFHILGMPQTSALLLLQVIAMGVLGAMVSMLFCRAMHLAPALYDKFLPNHLVRAAVGGALVVVLTLIIGSRDYNGAGTQLIAAALAGNAEPEAFLLKILLTALTLGAGFKGGEIVPAFFTGSTFGCAAASLIGLSPSFGAALGMIAVFCGVTNCPLTSILLAFELFGGEQLSMFALVCAISYMLSGYYSLYSEQKIVYSKLRPVYINRKAK
ncbi:MAG: chloride channel protein [Oscillospiraceae bacterium]|nr:chloride channel protein [Oscillospiraceae bacterium]